MFRRMFDGCQWRGSQRQGPTVNANRASDMYAHAPTFGIAKRCHLSRTAQETERSVDVVPLLPKAQCVVRSANAAQAQ